MLFFRFGVVKYDAVMELRKELDQLGKMGGITHAEKGTLSDFLKAQIYV